MATRPPIKTARMRDKSGRFIRHAEIRTTNTDILSLKDDGNRKALIRLDIPDDPFGIKYIAGPSPPDTDNDAAIEAFRRGYSRHYRLYLKFSGQIDGTVTCPADTDDGESYGFTIPKGDSLRTEFPELDAWLGRRRTVKLVESCAGFVTAF